MVRQITEPDALMRLREELGASVSVVMGPEALRYHPKLWLVERGDGLQVMSGSGNLTRGGLVDNDEQFELLQFGGASAEAAEHEERFAVLTANAIPLEAAEKSPAWLEWKAQLRRRRQLDDERRRLDQKLASRVTASREPDKSLLLHDLYDIYERTVAARLPRADGLPYVPSRFKQGLDRARDANNPVPLVARICRRQSEGFDVILRADRPDLTVEWLVVDETKSYHNLFPAETREISQARLRQFPSLAGPPPASPQRAGEDARALLSSLVGKTLRTLGTEQPNRILRLEGDQVIVATNRSPGGQPVPIEAVQAALDELQRAGRLRIDVPSVGHRSAFIGAVLRELPGTTADGQDVVRPA